jgi:protein Mpv17
LLLNRKKENNITKMMRSVVKAALTWVLLGNCDAFQMPASPSSLSKFPAGKLNSSTKLHSSVPITAVLTTLDTFWQTSPYAAAAIVCGFKASAADMVAQKRDYRKRAEKERKLADEIEAAKLGSQEPVDDTPIIYNPDVSEDGTTRNVAAVSTSLSKKADWKRNTAFLLYGSLYQGVAQEHIYNHLYPVWFGSGTSTTVVLAKVLFDLLVQTTLVTLPIAYITKSLIYRYSFREAMRRYVDDIRNHGLLKKYYLLWGPVQCITFSVVPEHWRVTFIAAVSFFWLIILSTIASKTKPNTFSAAIEEETVDECSLEDGLTCNIDG